MVVTISIVLVPAVTEDGLNVATAPVGNPLAEKLSVTAGPAPAGAVGIVKLAGWPAMTVCGAGGFGIEKPTIVSVSPLDEPPPGVGLNTVTEGVPVVAMAVAETDAINCVALVKVVAKAVPLSFTIEVLMKFVPVSISETAVPADTVEGCNPVRVGAGLPAALMVNVSAFDVPPPGAGFVTVTAGVPVLATSVARIDAVT